MKSTNGMRLKTLHPILMRAAVTLAVMMLTMMAFPTGANAYTYLQEGNWKYHISGSDCIIDAYTGSDKTTLTELTIPLKLGDNYVTYIASSSFHFSEFTNLQTLNFIQNTFINEMPFMTNCTKLAQINVLKSDGTILKNNALPLSIKTIPSNCFRGTAIGNLTFNGGTTMGSGIFRNCNSLTKVSIGQYTSIDDGAFSYIQSSCFIDYSGSLSDWSWQKIAYSPNLYVKCWNGFIGWCGDGGDSAQDLLYWTIDGSSNLTIACAAGGWSNFPDKQIIKTRRWNEITTAAGSIITSITLSQVYAIGANEFKGMANVTSVTLNDGLTSIGVSAFEGCTKLNSITIPASVTSIGADAFKGCTKLTTVTILGNPTIGAGAFPSGATVTMTQTANAAEGAYWMTFYNEGANFQADASTTVYKGTVSGSKLMLTEVEDKIVNASTAVILKSTSEHPVMTLTTSASTNTDANDLKGGSTVTAGNDAYTLAANGGVVGFYKFSGAALDPNKAHLEIPQGSLSRGFLSIGDDETTGIVDANFKFASQESRISNSLQRGDAWYSLDGRRLSGEPTRKGVYVRDGKKFVIK